MGGLDAVREVWMSGAKKMMKNDGKFFMRMI